MLATSTHTLKILAALLWYSGAVILLIKGTGLLLEAEALQPERNWTWLSVVFGLSIGWLKVKFIFRRACQKNLARIALLSEPKLWQFYRTGFLLFLVAMIIIGSTLSRMAQGDYPFLIAMAILDFSLATALFGSSYIFWTKQTFETTGGTDSQ